MDSAEIYHRPDTLEEALHILAANMPRVAAGCTDLFAATERKVLPGTNLDITAIHELRGIFEDESVVTIGATTTWRDIQDAPLPSSFDGLKLAAREVGARQIQNRGTVGGNLCNASPAADGIPPLLTLDASVVLQNAQTSRVLPLSEFMTGPRQTARKPDELVTAVRIPKASAVGESNFLKLGARKYLVISVAMTAARLVVQDGIVRQAALAIGACSPTAQRLPEAEEALIGRGIDPGLITRDHLAPYLSPIDDIRADAGYRLDVALELLRRTVEPFAGAKAA